MRENVSRGLYRRDRRRIAGFLHFFYVGEPHWWNVWHYGYASYPRDGLHAWRWSLPYTIDRMELQHRPLRRFARGHQ